MITANILGMSKDELRVLIGMARRELATGDDRLARQVVVSAARQLSAQIQHHVDETLTELTTLRNSLTAMTQTNSIQHENHP